jgi:hypothetical protein
MSQITDGLINDGETAHFKISYESGLSLDDGRAVAQGLMNVVEDLLAVIEGWFAGVEFTFSYPISIELHNAVGGAEWDSPTDWTKFWGFSPTVTVKAAGWPPPERGLDYVRYLLVGEITEMFMASKDNGWYEHTTAFTSGDEGSKGEGLSRFLARQFCVASGITSRFIDNEVVSLWMTSDRLDYLQGSPDDASADAVTGGTTCFLYYLHDQLGFSIPDIINAGSMTLAGVYQKLTGRTDAWDSFIGLVNPHYPPAPLITMTGDNIFPVPNLSSMDNGVRMVGGQSVDMWITLDRATPVDVTVQLSSDDPGTLQLPDTLTFPAGQQDLLFVMHALTVPGQTRVITVHATYAGATVNAPVTVLPAPSGLTGVNTSAADGVLVDAAVVLVDGPASAGVHREHFQLLTGPDGSYTAPGVAAGDYTIEGSASGYVPVTKTVTVID